MRSLLLMLLCSLAAAAAHASPRLVTELSQSRIDISYRFAGAELLVFGAIQYPGGRAPREPPGIAIVVRGPTEAAIVRQKQRVAGIWVNRDSMRFETVPGFYAVATTAPPRDLLDERSAAIHEIGTRHLQLSPVTGAGPEDVRRFEDGLVGVRTRRGLFVEQPYGVRITEDVLFRARIPIPSAVPVGPYQAEIYLISNGRVLARATAPIIVDKTGFERSVWLFAHQNAFLYGLLAVGLAIGSGLAAGTVMSRREA
jgi:uncharacterized protein (TIGR02186 family)